MVEVNRTGRLAKLLTIAPAALLICGVAAAEGDVSVSVVDGDLVIVGDSKANQFVVGKTGGGADEYEVIGNSGTTVNGMSFVVITASGNVLVDASGGSDRVRIDGNIFVDVTVDGGSGNDFLAIGCPTIDGHTTIEGGPGSDTIDLQDSSLETLDIRTGSGSDTVQFVFMVVNGDTAISLGPGADTVDIDGCCSVFNADLHIED